MTARLDRKGEWQILRWETRSLAEHEVDKYVGIVEGVLCSGQKKIALRIDPKTYPYSKFLSLLLRCHRSVQKQGAKMVVVQSNQDFLKTIRATRLHELITFVSSEDEVGAIKS